jgi:phosphoglucosamine mutase
MDKKYFGTDGIRDVANTGHLTPVFLLRASQGLGEMLRRREGLKRFQIALGGDTRISLDMIRASLVAGFTAQGCDAIDFGMLPTPALAHLTRSRKLDLGIMISASHNPVRDNGIKVFGPDGFKLPDETELEVEALIDDQNWALPFRTGEDLGRLRQDREGLEEYITHLLGYFRDLRLDGLTVGVDCSNGAASYMAPEVLTRLGASVKPMAHTQDGTNINRDCGSVHPGRLCALVKAEGCDLGVALDGDADRSLFVDASGRALSGDYIIALLARHMHERGRLNHGRCAATIMSNLGLDQALKEAGISLVRTAVGDRAISQKLREEDLSLGGEQSGHMLFGKENHYTGDGVFTTLKVLQVMAETGKTLADLASAMTEFPQVLINVPVQRKPPPEETPGILEAIRKAEERLGETGRVVYRYSGTEKLARVMVEGPEESEVQGHANAIAEAVKKEIG